MEASRLKTGRLGRITRMARAGLGSAVSIARASPEGLEVAASRLGELRGLGAKVGQMAGLVEANLPPEIRQKAGPALARLRDQTLRSPWEDVRALLTEELGAPPEACFDAFETVPFASASLGQVHRATWEGRDVAVKVQHPGIEDAFRADLENVTGLAALPMPLLMPRRAGRDFLSFVREGFLAELDYEREAASQRRFARLAAEIDGLKVPEVIDARSTSRVLTTAFAHGVPVGKLEASPASRARFAFAIRDFTLGSLLRHGVLYADAHAGNFLFRRDGQGDVNVLDFGSVFDFDDARRDAFRGVARAALADPTGQGDAFRAAVSRMVGYEDEEPVRVVAEIQNVAFGALVRGDAMRPDHLKQVTERAARLKSSLLRARVPLPPFMPFWMRTTLALVALLVALSPPPGPPLVVPGE